jgi:hypothetical protein
VIFIDAKIVLTLDSVQERAPVSQSSIRVHRSLPTRISCSSCNFSFVFCRSESASLRVRPRTPAAVRVLSRSVVQWFPSQLVLLHCCNDFQFARPGHTARPVIFTAKVSVFLLGPFYSREVLISVLVLLPLPLCSGFLFHFLLLGSEEHLDPAEERCFLLSPAES